jgi:hypothetical protein
MKRLKEYIAESAGNHVYVIKFAERPTQEQVDVISTWLKKYDLKATTSADMIEEDHVDFIDVPNRQPHAMRVSLGMAISPYVLLQDLKIAANISEKFIVVRAENDPLELEAEHDSWKRLQDIEAKASDKEHAARLSTDREYLDAEQPPVDHLFGDDYNKKLLTYLAGVAQSRPTMEQEPAAPLFSWIQMEDIDPGEPHQDTSDFNAHLNTPKPVSKGNESAPIDSTYLNSKGTMNDDSIRKVKFFKDSNTGKATQVVQPAQKG